MSRSSGPSTANPRAKRACDACRERRMKCVFAEHRTSCQPCSSRGRKCEFLKPAPDDNRKRSKRVRRKVRLQDDDSQILDSLRGRVVDQGIEPRYLGATSLSGLIASILNGLPANIQQELEKFDRQHSHFRISVTSTREPVVLVGSGEEAPDETLAQDGAALALSIEGEALTTSIACHSVLVSLMHSFCTHFFPVFPVISVSELCSLEPALSLSFPADLGDPPPTPLPKAITKLAVCAIAALSREVPRRIYHSLLVALTKRLNGPEGMRLIMTSCLGNVQALMLMSVSAEVHSRSTNEGGSWSWLRTGAGIRMAMDIGLHRDLESPNVPRHQLNRRNRVWASAVIADRWYALSFGQPMTINLLDCDAPGPSLHRDSHEGTLDKWERPYAFFAEVNKLSIMLGRVLRAAYAPAGHYFAHNEAFVALQEDLERWRNDLHSGLRFDPAVKNVHAGLIHLLDCCVELAFLRSFLRPQIPIPPALTYRPEPGAWSVLVEKSAAAIHWCATEGSLVFDTWFPVMYSLTWCFFTQFREYETTRDIRRLQSMQEAQQCYQSWLRPDEAGSTGHFGLRHKVASLVTFLTDAALRLPKTPPPQMPIATPNPQTLINPDFQPHAPPMLENNGSSQPADIFSPDTPDLFNLGDLIFSSATQPGLHDGEINGQAISMPDGSSFFDDTWFNRDIDGAFQPPWYDR